MCFSFRPVMCACVVGKHYEFHSQTVLYECQRDFAHRLPFSSVLNILPLCDFSQVYLAAHK